MEFLDFSQLIDFLILFPQHIPKNDRLTDRFNSHKNLTRQFPKKNSILTTQFTTTISSICLSNIQITTLPYLSK